MKCEKCGSKMLQIDSSTWICSRLYEYGELHRNKEITHDDLKYHEEYDFIEPGNV